MQSDISAELGLFPTLCLDNIDSAFEEVKLASLVQLDDTFVTEDRWPI